MFIFLPRYICRAVVITFQPMAVRTKNGRFLTKKSKKNEANREKYPGRFEKLKWIRKNRKKQNANQGEKRNNSTIYKVLCEHPGKKRDALRHIVLGQYKNTILI